MNVQDMLAANGIKIPSTAPGRYETTCPRCSSGRSTSAHRAAKVLGITIDIKGVMWGCNHCGWIGPEKGTGKANGYDRSPRIAYEYEGTKGERLRKVRNLPGLEPRFWWQHWNGTEWAKGTGGAKPRLYNFTEVQETIACGHEVVIVEGEKDVESLRKIGLVATCNPDGAAKPGQRPKWTREHSEQLRGAHIVVMGDNDDAGLAHMQAAARTSAAIAASVKVLDLAAHFPTLKPGGDISDLLADGLTRKKLDELLDQAPEWRAPAGAVGQSQDGTLRQQDDGAAGKFDWRKSGIKFKELQKMKFQPMSFLVKGVIPSEGVTLLCSKPKKGKSFMVLDLALAATMDRFTLGDNKPVQGDVLYLALEDNHRRLQDRGRKLLASDSDVTWPETLHVFLQWRRLDQGGADDIREWVAEVRAAGRQVAFVAIDVFAHVRRPGDVRKAYEIDVAAVKDVKKIADELGIAVIIVHHLRKQGSDDPMDLISGTQGLAGTADTLIVIGSAPSGLVMHVRGRDVEENDLAMEFNKNTGKWTIKGKVAEVAFNDTTDKIMEVLREAGGAPTTSKKISEATGLRSHTISVTLGRLAKAGQVKQVARGEYCVSDP